MIGREKTRMYLFMRSFSNIEQFTPEREHPVSISANHTEASNSQRFGWVSFSQNQSTITRVFCAGIIGVIQFWNPFKFRMFRAVALFVQLRLGFEFHPTLNAFDDPTLARLQERILVACWLIFHVFFCACWLFSKLIFQKNSGTLPECQAVLIQIRTNVLDPNCLQKSLF